MTARAGDGLSQVNFNAVLHRFRKRFYSGRATTNVTPAPAENRRARLNPMASPVFAWAP